MYSIQGLCELANLIYNTSRNLGSKILKQTKDKCGSVVTTKILMSDAYDIRISFILIISVANYNSDHINQISCSSLDIFTRSSFRTIL